MMNDTLHDTRQQEVRVAVDDLERFMGEALTRAGADTASSAAVTRALVTASRMGTDSHGLRLLPHYIRALEGGRVTGAPEMRFARRLPATGVLDAGDGFGHLAGYTAMTHAVEMAFEVGLGAVAVGHSSHFGAAGCYALAAAERGMIGLAVCNSDPFVLLHQGLSPFHGTNPIAFAVILLPFIASQNASPFDVVGAPVEVYAGPRVEFGGRLLGVLMTQNMMMTVAKLGLVVDLFLGGATNVLELIAKVFALFLLTTAISIAFPRLKTEQTVDFFWTVPLGLAVLGVVLNVWLI